MMGDFREIQKYMSILLDYWFLCIDCSVHKVMDYKDVFQQVL